MKLIINIIIALLVALAAFFGVKYYLGDKTPDAGVQATRPTATLPTTSSGATTAVSYPGAIRTDDFLALLRAADKIKFTSDLLDDPIFLELEDFHQSLPDREVGRINPFAPFSEAEKKASASKTATGTPARQPSR